MYAVIATGGKQYRVQEGAVVRIEKLDAEQALEAGLITFAPDDLDWDELMLFVRDGRVVPVIGNHLLRVTVDGGTLSQGGTPLVWDTHGYYEVALGKGSVTLSP